LYGPTLGGLKPGKKLSYLNNVPLSDKQEVAVKSRSLTDVLLAQLVKHEEMLQLAKRNR